MGNKQTAVEWLFLKMNRIRLDYEIGNLNDLDFIENQKIVFKQAKVMEEQQRRKDFFAGVKCTEEGRNGEFARVNRPNIELVFLEDFEEYINPNEQDNGK